MKRRAFIKNASVAAGCVGASTFLPFGSLLANGEDSAGGFGLANWLETSKHVTLAVNGSPVWVEHFEVPTPREPNMTDRERNLVHRIGEYIGDSQQVNIARVGISGASYEVSIRPSAPVAKCIVRPKRLGITPQSAGVSELTFKVPAGEKLYVEINDNPPLLIFPHPRDIGSGKKEDYTYYYGAGVHQVGELVLKSGETVFVDEQAVVYGRFVASDSENIRIFGYGILDTTKDEVGRALRFTDCRDIHVEGLTVRSSKIGWMCVPEKSENVVFKDLRVLGFGTNNDGIDIVSSSHVTIQDCFIRSTDDCIALKTWKQDKVMQDITITGCMMYGFASSDGVTIGCEIRDPVEHINVTNCDILAGKGSSTSGGHPPFSIVCDGTGPVKHVLFEDIRVEENVDFLSFKLIVTNGKHYVNLPPGAIHDVTIRNVHWERDDRPFVIFGQDANSRVEDVKFEDCTIGGKPLTSARDSGFLINKYTANISFTHNGKTKRFRSFG